MKTSNKETSETRNSLRDLKISLDILDYKKMLSTNSIRVLLFFIFFIGLKIAAYSQASLAAENNIDDISITTKEGKKKVYSVCQDARIRTQWYYFPNEIRLAEEVDVNGKIRPKMTILRYQYKDKITHENKEGGILVAAFTYAIEPEAVSQIKKEINRRKGISNVTVSAMKFRSSKIDFLTTSNEFIGDVDAKSVTSNGATTASQEMIISFKLTALGTSVIKGLVSGKGGVPIRANITYNGLTPPCGYTVKANFKDLYEFMEEKKLKEAGLSIGPLKFGGSKSKQKLVENLNKIKNMDIKVIECSLAATDSTGGAQSNTDYGLQALLDKINKELFNPKYLTKAKELEKLESLLKSTNNKKVEERIIDMMSKGKASIQLGYQKGVKNITRRNQGAINWDFSKQQMMTISSSFGGQLSFSKYGLTEEQLIEEGYIIDIDANADFPSVMIGLPNLSPDFQLRNLTLEISYTNSNGKTHTEARQWHSTKGWVTPTDEAVGYIRFNLIGEKNLERIKNPEFDIKIQVVSKIPNASFTIRKKTRLTTGERFIDAIELLTKQVIVDGSSLDFARTTNNTSDLAIAKLKFNIGNLSINRDIKPYSINGIPGPPSPLYLLIPNNESDISSEITFIRNDGIKIKRTSPLELGDNTLLNYEWRVVQD